MHKDAEHLMSIRCDSDPRYPYRMTYTKKNGEVEEFHFLADNKELAGDHARHICSVEGWTLHSVYREK